MLQIHGFKIAELLSIGADLPINISTFVFYSLYKQALLKLIWHNLKVFLNAADVAEVHNSDMAAIKIL